MEVAVRVADSVVTNTLIGNLRRSFSRIDRFQQDLATGVTIHKGSDNPAGASRSLLLRSDIRNNEQYQRNIGEAIGQMDFVDSTLDNMVNTIIDIQSIAVAGASDTVNPDDRDIMAKEVDELLEHVVSMSQTKFRGRFVFAGTETLEKPYEDIRNAAGQITSVGNAVRSSLSFNDTTTSVGALLGQLTPPSGNVTVGDQVINIDLATDSLDAIKAKIDTVAPQGVKVTIEESLRNGSQSFRLNIEGTDTVVDQNLVLQSLGIGNVDTTNGVLREVGDGIHVQINVEGQDLFEGAQNVFIALLNLRNSLAENDIDGIRSSITDMQVARDKISEVRGTLGARTERVEVQRSLLERFEVNLTNALSDTEDADLSKTVLQLRQEQNVFQSALVAGQTIIQPTLMDFLS
jgi:flagellar hook-associated protein 3 FlgL